MMNSLNDDYLIGARKLRHTMAVNRKDADFAAIKGNEIVYIFDANVFLFYADLSDRKRLTQEFDSLVGRASTDEIKRVMERVTADYLFSTRLPAQAGPCFVSVQHFSEVTNRCAHIARKLASDNGIRQVVNEYRSDISDILTSEIAVAEKLTKLSEIVPKAMLDQLDAAEHFVGVAGRFFDGPSPGLMPLDHTDWGARAGQLRLPDVTRWKNRLRQTKKHVDDDAETLATIVNLYADQATNFGSPTKLFLFVTADNAIRQAVEQEARELSKEGIPVFTRSPSDYLPLINLASIREAALPKATSAATRRELTAVFNALEAALKSLDADPVVLTKGQGAAQTASKTDPLIEQLHELWAKASEVVSVLSATYFQEKSVMAFKELEAFVADPTTTEVATRLIEQSVDSVRDRHLVLSLKNAVTASRGLRKGHGNHIGRRVHLKLMGVEFESLIFPKQSLIGFLETIIDRGISTTLLNTMGSNPDRIDCQLLATCIFTATERWHTAAQFAERAQALSGSENKNIFAREAAYLQALCLRLSLQTPEQYRKAISLLNRNLNDRELKRSRSLTATLCRIRDQVELGTIRVSAAVLQDLLHGREAFAKVRWGVNPFITEKYVGSTFAIGVKNIREALEDIIDAEPFDFGNSVRESAGAPLEEIVRWIKLQALGNLCGAFIFQTLRPALNVGSKIAFSELDTSMMRELIALEERAGRPVTLVQSVYMSVFEALTQEDRGRREASVAIALGLLNSTDAHSARLPLCDEIEFEYLRRALPELGREMRGRE